MAFPVPGSVRADAVEHGGDAQHRLAARLAPARRARARWASRVRPRDDRAGRRLDARCSAQPAPALYHPYISRGRRARAVRRCQRPGAVHRPVDAARLLPTSCARSIEGLAFAARDCYAAMGHVPRGDPPHRRRRALPGAAHDPRRARSAPPCATARARRPARRRGDDGRGRARPLSRSWSAASRDWVDAAAGRARASPIRRSPRSTTGSSRPTVGARAGDAAGLARRSAASRNGAAA